MKITRVISLVLSLTTIASLADDRGAKAIFVDCTSGAVISSAAARPPGRKPTSGQKPAGTRAPLPPVAEVSGLMYYVELVSPSGETSRVTTERVFKSGERIRLHVVSSIDGDIAVFQRAPDGRATKLFPDDRIRNGSPHIVKGADTVLPSPTSWFRFDQNPGTEELTLILTPRTASAGPRESSSAAQLAAMQFEAIKSASGSKGLIVETDSTGPAQGTYVVRQIESGRPPETVVAAVRLKHS